MKKVILFGLFLIITSAPMAIFRPPLRVFRRPHRVPIKTPTATPKKPGFVNKAKPAEKVANSPVISKKLPSNLLARGKGIALQAAQTSLVMGSGAAIAGGVAAAVQNSVTSENIPPSSTAADLSTTVGRSEDAVPYQTSTTPASSSDCVEAVSVTQVRQQPNTISALPANQPESITSLSVIEITLIAVGTAGGAGLLVSAICFLKLKLAVKRPSRPRSQASSASESTC